jgi:transcriptional regulator with XRE-family HTH domain
LQTQNIYVHVVYNAMPRPESHYSILREIRKILGWTQTVLAKRIGTTLTSIARIENGTLPLSRKLALRICGTTHVPYKDLIGNKKGHPQDVFGRPLTKSTIEDSAKKAASLTPGDYKNLVQNAAARAELVYRVLKDVRLGSTTVWAMDAAIQDAFETIAREFGIEKEVDRLRLGDPGKIKIQVERTVTKPTLNKSRAARPPIATLKRD